MNYMMHIFSERNLTVKPRTKKNLLLPLLAGFIILIAARDIFSLTIPFNILSLYSLCAILLLPRKMRGVYICALLPFCRGIPYSEIILVYLLTDILLNYRHTKIRIKMYLPILFITLLDLIDMIVFQVLSGETIYLFVYMFFITYIIDQRLFDGMERKIIFSFVVSVFFATFFVVVREIKLYGLDYIFTYNVRFGANTDGKQVTNFNANELGLYCSTAVAFLLMLNLNGIKHEFTVAFAIALTGLGMLSVSRSFLLVVLLVWSMYFVFSNKKLKSILIFVLLFIAVILMVQRLFPDILAWVKEFYQERNDQALTDKMGGRLEILFRYFKLSTSSVYGMLFGYSEQYRLYFNEESACHNGFQEIYVSWGIIGCVLAAFWIIQMMRNVKCAQNRSFSRYMSVIAFFVFILAIQLFTMHNYLILMGMTFIAMNIGVQNERKIGKTMRV